ncbi:hypothetical protein CGCS363_v003718 [Colletotrichum siamense]|uniref:uncharacterized protein n=1 Tax=Colletotrichum siamense TaxID=690259 RepID=UPI00187244B5|nr:uncharacterized protein CGCS363_v003718 [Colletotrichum siamense]KAF5510265.1 hypothetical protein CGCS363_v003718 [Colletotrichum siamense]
MVFTSMVLACRKDVISHDEFERRYEQHLVLVEQLCGNAMPLKHTRYYPQHGGADDKPIVLFGNNKEMKYDVIVTIEFEDEAAWQKFGAILSEPEAAAKIAADEDGFWDRNQMHVFNVGGVKVWERK